MKLSDILKYYVEQKKEIDKLNDVIKEKNKLVETKNTILQYMNKKHLKELKYNDSKFIVKNNKTYSSFTQKYLKDTIKNYFDNNQGKTNVDDLIKFILNNRQETVQSDLQLSLNK